MQKEEERQEYRKEFKCKRKAVRAVMKKGKDTVKLKKDMARAYKLKKYPTGLLTQKHVQQFAPPGCYTWRSSRGSWQVHIRPWPRKSRSWAVEGEEEAAKFVLRYAWSKFLHNSDLSNTDCPFTGLMEDVAV